MARQALITAIDLGTDKCVTLIAGVDPDSKHLQVLGVSVVPSKGIKKSQIVDLEQVMSTLTESVDGAERMAGLEVESAYISVSGATISSQNSRGVVAVASPNQEIIQEDVERVIEAARAISLPADREILHVIPHDFTVDSQEGIKDPVGMTGIRLETEAHIITGMGTAMRNIGKCVHDLGLEVDGFVFSGLASAEVVLTETEKELGVVLVDIGAGSTAICAYVEGALSHTAVLPVGARHITQDIALGCRVSLDAAEKIKVSLTSETAAPLKPKTDESKEDFRQRQRKADQVDLRKLGIEDQVETLSKKTVIEGIMVPRIKEICTLIGKELQEHNVMADVPAGLVITGGGAETAGFIDVAKRTLNLPARVGKPVELVGLIEDIHKPSFATAIGLLEYGKRKGVLRAAGMKLSFGSFKPSFNAGSLSKTLTQVFKSLLP